MFKMKRMGSNDGGFTLVELLITIMLVGTISVSLLTLFVSLVNSSIVAKREAVALTLATNQMESLKSLPYDSLNGNTVTSTTKKVNGVTYTVTTAIKYIDDAYDGCSPTITAIQVSLRPIYCRNYISTSATNDNNANDYKSATVTVTDSGHTHLAQLDSQISARVAEAASTNGALFATVIDSSGNPISGASVNISDITVNPNVNHTLITDQNGIVIDYSLTPDSGHDYIITASATGYSTLNTIAASGTLQATYPNQSIISQQASSVTLTLKQQGANSLVVEATDTSGTPLSGLKVYAKGGYKKYTLTTDTSYYYDNMSPSDTRPTTDVTTGLTKFDNLVPGTYIFCGDDGSSNCKIGATTYYLAAAVPYTGTNVFNPIIVPTFDPDNPPATTYTYGTTTTYLQKVRLIFTTLSTFPRVNTISPYDASLSSGTPSSFAFTITGSNLPCSAIAASCATSVKFVQGSNTYTASCTGAASPATKLTCTVNISTATAGNSQLLLSTSAGTLTIPTTLTLGGLIVTP